MRYLNTSQRYGSISIILHWFILLLILPQVILAFYANMEPVGLTKFILLSRHKTLGILILMVTLLRIVWRFVSPPPAFPESMSSVEQTVARLTHVSIYLILIALPVVGWFLSSAANISINFFDLFILPDLIEPNKSAVEPLKRLHLTLAIGFALLLFAHISAALWHHFARKDAVLQRMLPFINQRSNRGK